MWGVFETSTSPTNGRPAPSGLGRWKCLSLSRPVGAISAHRRREIILLKQRNGKTYNRYGKPQFNGHLEYLPLTMVPGKMCTLIS